MATRRIATTRRREAVGLINLTQRRHWFDEAGQGGSGGGSSAGTQNTEPMIPKSRLDEVLEQKRQAEAALQKFKDDHTAAEAERLQKQGEWQQIAENEKKAAEALKPFKDRAEALENMIREGNKTRIERVPEEMRGLIPMDYPPERLALWLDANWDRLSAKPAPNIDAGAGGAGGNGTPKLTADEAKFAKDNGMTAEEFAAAKKKAGLG